MVGYNFSVIKEVLFIYIGVFAIFLKIESTQTYTQNKLPNLKLLLVPNSNIYIKIRKKIK